MTNFGISFLPCKLVKGKKLETKKIAHIEHEKTDPQKILKCVPTVNITVFGRSDPKIGIRSTPL